MSQTTPHTSAPAKAPETAAAIARKSQSGEPESQAARARKPEAGNPPVTIKVAATPTAKLQSQRHQMIAEAAYFRAEERGFAVGSEVEDWLAAEAEIDQLLNAAKPPRA